MPISAPTRDEKLLEGIIKHKYLRTDQAAELFFKAIKDKRQRERKASTRLLKFHQAKMVNRFRFPGTPYIYTTSGTRYSPKILHYLTITDVLLELLPLFPASTRTEYEIELRQGEIITDLYLSYKNEFRGTFGELCIEVELDSSGSIFEKIAKYETLLEDKPGRLIVVCKHRRTIDRIKAHEFDIPVQAIDLRYIREQFTLEAIASK